MATFRELWPYAFDPAIRQYSWYKWGRGANSNDQILCDLDGEAWETHFFYQYAGDLIYRRVDAIIVAQPNGIAGEYFWYIVFTGERRCSRSTYYRAPKERREWGRCWGFTVGCADYLSGLYPIIDAPIHLETLPGNPQMQYRKDTPDG